MKTEEPVRRGLGVLRRFTELLLAYMSMGVIASLTAYFCLSLLIQLPLNLLLPPPEGRRLIDSGFWERLTGFGSWLLLVWLGGQLVSRQSRWDRADGWHHPLRFGLALALASSLLAVPVLLAGHTGAPVFDLPAAQLTGMFRWLDRWLPLRTGRLLLLLVNGAVFLWFYMRQPKKDRRQVRGVEKGQER